MGEIFEIETWDAGIGFFKSSADKAIPANRHGFDRTPPLVNLIAGPIFIEGLDRGDTLVVKIHQIEVEKTSWIAVGPNRGSLGESSRWNEISGEYSTMVFDHSPGSSGTTIDGTLHFTEKISWPITPFVGTLGVAPDRDVANSLDRQGNWCGNRDIRDFKMEMQ
ncbi:acetamidase/formamidase family protein [Daejeonella sp.]|uniref:acetamidase/formamidase family protein n=1 Tax=Daejeonella sp. TaxID=2805397 RepID=UPI00272FCF00|nr:acetamidase/formamidase family protein [Daejeonella sp.]MDP2414474.1 acetamidase/formamidase family protein [Daejeonella sp.]